MIRSLSFPFDGNPSSSFDARQFSLAPKFRCSIALPSPPTSDRCRRTSRRLRRTPCAASLGNGDRLRFRDGRDERDQFVEALLLIPETRRHYNMWKKGFAEEAKSSWHDRNFQLRNRVKGPKAKVEPIDHDFLRQFRGPTIFLKILCDGDILLPLSVGDFAITRLFDDSKVDQHEESLDLYDCLKDMMTKFSYEVKMVCITKKVVSTYHARMLLGKPVERATMNIDARPSDALIVAKRFKVPILVSKEIVLNYAIKTVRGTQVQRNSKSIYDVELDSAPEGSDPISEEFSIYMKMNIAAMEERYQDAAIWRDKLYKYHEPRSEG